MSLTIAPAVIVAVKRSIVKFVELYFRSGLTPGYSQPSTAMICSINLYCKNFNSRYRRRLKAISYIEFSHKSYAVNGLSK